MRPIQTLILALLLSGCTPAVNPYTNQPWITFTTSLGRRSIQVANPTDRPLTLWLDCEATSATLELAPKTTQTILAHPWDRTCHLTAVK